MKVVDRAVLPKNACTPSTKLVPERSRVKAPEPALTDDGSRVVSVGVGLRVPTAILTVVGLNPPPGAGLNTPSGKVPALDKYAAGTAASSCVDEV
jgi:hypothetical protein